MTKLDRLNSFLSERLSAALNEIIFTVNMTMKEYEEETARIRKENYHLKELLKIKITECSVTEETTGVVSSALPSGQQDCNSNSELESESQESQTEPQRLKEENWKIKKEQPSYSTDTHFEPEARQTFEKQTDFPEDSVQCSSLLNTQTDDQEMTDYEFPAKIKIESVNTDIMDNADASTLSWSPHNWDVISENSDQRRTQHVLSQQPYNFEDTHSVESASQNRPVEFRAAFSYSNRIICNNTLHCTSKHCEMQKRTIAKSSPVWKYFSLKEGDCSKAVCLMCKAVISRGVKEYTTSALLKHLRMKHGKC
ncbi:uncharacterized protein [Hoplias malabaricus]|uniref:uncharacterized protein n=1 Tax=Hoplias malabaricus TaxID=27720 RepID=UPI0034628E5F